MDEEERNDESFIFVLETKAGRLNSVRLHPTIISDCQAQRASGERAHQIVARMKKLCDDMKTYTYDRDDGLEIPVGEA